MRRMIYLSLGVCVLILGMSMKLKDLHEDGLHQPHIHLQEVLLPKQGGILRGIHFSMSPEEVSSMESSSVEVAKKKRYLAYEFKLTAPQSKSFGEVYYKFDRKRLDWIGVETFHENTTSAAALFHDLKSHFNEKYGVGLTAEDGFYRWRAKDSTSGEVFEIAMKDVSTQDDPGLFIEFYTL